MTLGELRTGVERLRKRDADEAAALDAWVDEVLTTFTVIVIFGSIYRAWARQMPDRPESRYDDALIAATASARGFVVVTRNTRYFRTLGATVLDPFAASR